MMRSEMIDLIYRTMQDNHFGQDGLMYKMAEDVLNTIEENAFVIPSEGWEDEKCKHCGVKEGVWCTTDHLSTCPEFSIPY